MRLTEVAIRERQDFAIQQNVLTMRNRVNQLGVAEAVVQRQGLDRILVQLPGIQDPGRAKDILSSTATLEFHLVDHTNDAFEAERRNRAPLGSELHHREDGSPVLLQREVIASGDQLLDAIPTYQQGRPVVSIKLDSTGGRRMLDATIDNVGRNLAVLFVEDRPQFIERDGERVPGPPVRTERVISDATINDPLSNNFVITGLTVFEGQRLALLLRAGSLAAPIVPIEERTIGPSLGRENIERGIEATLIGYLLVVAFIGLWYRMFGMLANMALFINVIMIVALMSLIPGAALTLPGIAGIVLTVGMSVDANVLIFERIREELGNGNSPQNSIRAGWDKAYTTIVDSNLTTLIAAIVLFMFGTGPIKGFAVTLSLGIATSMFTAITVTRSLVNLVYGNRTNLKTLSIGGRKLAATNLPRDRREIGRCVFARRGQVPRSRGSSRDTPEDRPWGSCAHIPVRTRSREGLSRGTCLRHSREISGTLRCDIRSYRQRALERQRGYCRGRLPGRGRQGRRPAAYRDVLAAVPADALCEGEPRCDGLHALCRQLRCDQRRDERSDAGGEGGEELRERGVGLGVAGDDVAAVEIAVAAVEVADAPAGLANDQRAGRDVPLAQAQLEERVDAPGRDVAQVERRGARSPHPGRLEHHDAQHVQVALEVHEVRAIREARCDQRLLQVRALADANAPPVELRALAAARREDFLAHRIVDDAVLELAFARDADRHREVREAV